jgi:hypothetical protein
MAADYGLSGLNKYLKPNSNNNFNTDTALNTANLITAVRVTYILLDDSDPVKFKNYGGWNGLGTIEYELVTEKATTNPPPKAFPLNPNTKNYPIVNEIVYLISLPDTDIGKATSSLRSYYIDIVSLWNHPHHNAYPSKANEPTPPLQKDYIETQIGSAKIVTNEAKKIFLGNTFIEKPNIHPLLPFEGDFIQEGRWGNSIRLGSTVKGRPNNWSSTGTNGDPITIIRNGQGQQTEDGWIPITENINNDSSSIYLTSNQIIPLTGSSIDYTSYEGTGYSSPITPNLYKDNQIILSSGRLVLNSNNDHILLSSAKSVNLNAQTSVNIDTNIFVVQSNRIYLGNAKLATEPLIYGKKTTDLLRQLVQTLIPLVKALQFIQTEPVVQGAPVTFKNLYGPTLNLLVILNSLTKELGVSSENCTLISKNNFTL